MLSTLRRCYARCYASSSSSPVPLYCNVCSSLEEESLINYFNNTIFNRKKYEGEHWDDVIHRYKETELVGYAHKRIPEDVYNIIHSLENFIKTKYNLGNRKLLVPHVIDLDKNGKINPHIDSIKFSGDLIAGYSLGSTRVMRLSHETNANDNPIDIILPPRSLYILSGDYRYKYNHSILGVDEKYKDIDVQRRISIIFRDEKAS